MNSVVAIYETHSEAEEAVKELQRSGFDMKKMSIVGKDYHTDEQVVGYYNAGDRMKYWGKMGAFWGGIWGWLFGAAFFAIPGEKPTLRLRLRAIIHRLPPASAEVHRSRPWSSRFRSHLHARCSTLAPPRPR